MIVEKRKKTVIKSISILDWKFAEGGELNGGIFLEVDGGGIEKLFEI